MTKRIMQCTLIALATCGIGAGAYADETFVRSNGTVIRTFEPATKQAVVVVERSPRTVYLDEWGHPYVESTSPSIVVVPTEIGNDRWAITTHDDGGMTPADVSHITGKVDSSTSGMPMSGSGVQPGNMGPANAKGQ